MVRLTVLAGYGCNFDNGIWVLGTPVDLCPEHDDDESLWKSNNFDYHPVDKHDKCPFAAHTRKMRPRGDLEHDHSVIIRRGISYGGEVTPEEKAARKSDYEQERGLLFVCYQSDLRNGFNFLTTRECSTCPTTVRECTADSVSTIPRLGEQSPFPRPQV
jgi:hypothetical protein